MSYHEMNASRKPGALQLIGAVLAILVNGTLYLMVNALFAIDSGISGGGMAS